MWRPPPGVALSELLPALVGGGSESTTAPEPGAVVAMGEGSEEERDMKTRADKLIALAVDQKGTPEGRLAAMAAMGHKLTKEQAVTLAGLKWWEGAELVQVGAACLGQSRLCCPFDELHRGVEAFMGRPVWTHEFVDPERLRRERNGETVADPLQMLVDMAGRDRVIALLLD
jgi:hypothetical protein